ncbi:MAG: hypothetical protein JJU02_02720 [Cryomorphaceae bacterium]|nr:hypothetical protein [Cryomorphaceae bacterium]
MKTIKNWMAFILPLTLIFLTSACKDDDDNGSQPTHGDLSIELDHGWGPSHAAFSLNQELTHPATQEKITFTKLRYYVSNIELTKADGEVWKEEESYRIATVGQSTSGVSMEIKDIPVGEYEAITFTIGVDAPRNTSGAQTGALSPSEGMFWSWTTGYIFIMAEGMSPDAPNGQFMYHVGGFEGSENAIRTTTLNFAGTNVNVNGTGKPKVKVKVNTARFWHGGISLNDINAIHMPGANAVVMADNFIGAFSFDGIEN